MSTRPRIIAFTGPKTCGKDSISQVFFDQNYNSVTKQHFNYFVRVPFAQGIKQICHDVFGWSFEDMDNPVFKETVLTEWPNCEPRWPMMEIGNWFRDKYGHDVWVHGAKNRIKSHENTHPAGAYIITDLRFPNELAWLKEVGAFIIYIDRPSAEEALAQAKLAGDLKALNPSEAHYELLRDNADLVLANDAELYKAQQQAIYAVRNRFGYWSDWEF